MIVKNKSIFTLILILLSLLFLCDFFLKTIPKEEFVAEYYKEPYVSFKSPIILEYSEDEDYNPLDDLDVILDKNKSSYDSIESLKVEVNKYGSFKGTIRLKLKDVVVDRTFNYSINDEEPPVLFLLKPFNLKVNEKFEILDFVKVEDNSVGEEDKGIIPKIVGNFNISKAGQYSVIVEAEDSSGNKASFATQIKVTDDNLEQVPINNNQNSGILSPSRPSGPSSPSLPNNPSVPQQEQRPQEEEPVEEEPLDNEEDKPEEIVEEIPDDSFEDNTGQDG